MRRVIFAILCISVGICGEEIRKVDFIQKNTSATSEKILSRKKRYLIFPEGSSLQLVYCLTMPVIGESTIFTIGGTAALAWELPHDPFQPYRKKAELLHRKDPPGKYTIKDPITNKKQSLPSKAGSQSPINLVETFDPFATAPIRYHGYQKPPSASASVRFPSINYSPAYNRYRYQKYQDRRRQQTSNQQQFNFEGWKSRAPVYYQPTLPTSPIQLAKGDRVTPVNNVPVRGGWGAGEREGELYYKSPEVSTSSGYRPSIYHQVHRRTRRDLYGKIEKFLSTQSKDGKACLLRAICEIHQKGIAKGSFMEEIMKAVFRAKPSEEHENSDVYDDAANINHNCTELYSNCDSSILNFI